MGRRLTTFDDLYVGQQASVTKTITKEAVAHFIAITGDVNPLHVDESFAQQTFFKRPIAHGMLSAALFSYIVGMLLPGTGAIYRSQSLVFLRPVYVGDTLKASLEIIEIDREAELIEMQGMIRNQNDQAVIEGKATATLLRGFQKPPPIDITGA